MPSERDPFALPTLEAQPPFALQAAQEGVPLMDGGRELGVARVDQRPGAFAPEPAMPIRQLLNVARIEASPHGCRALTPGVGQESLQDATVGAVAGRDLDHLAYSTGAHVVQIPPEQPPPAFEDGARAQLSMACLA